MLQKQLAPQNWS